LRDGDSLNFFKRDAGSRQRFVNNRVNFLQMLARRELRHDAAESLCSSICEEITDDKISRPSRTTAAAVSSHELSILKLT
jgi:hypothetical protein